MSKSEELVKAVSRVRELFDGIKKKQPRKDQQLGVIPYRVIHYKSNPSTAATKKRESRYADIKSENAMLKACISMLESGNSADVTMRINNALDSAEQIEILSRKVEEAKAKEEKYLTSFKKTNRRFREACYLLTGYMIEPLKDNIFALSNMYAEREEDKLFFEVKRMQCSLLGNDYVERFSDYVSTYLMKGHSFPAFLAKITLDLFQSSTHNVDMSLTLRNEN